MISKFTAGLLAAGVVLGMPTSAAAAQEEEEEEEAARSTSVTLCNFTSEALRLTRHELDHGKWTVAPPDEIPPSTPTMNSCGDWESQSDGFLTGTQGSATYYLQDEGNVAIEWDNPFVGSNSYRDSFPKGFIINRSGGGGNNASVTFDLEPE